MLQGRKENNQGVWSRLEGEETCDELILAGRSVGAPGGWHPERSPHRGFGGRGLGPGRNEERSRC